MLFIITPGHYEGSPGACHDGFCEYPETEKWADLLIECLLGMGQRAVKVGAISLSKKINMVNGVCHHNPDALLVSIHFNSYAGKKKINGSETLYCPGSKKGKALAEYVQPRLAEVMRNKDRGVKEGWYRMDKANGPDAILAQTRCPSIIIEPEFVQSHKNIVEKREKACLCLADALIDYAEEHAGV